MEKFKVCVVAKGYSQQKRIGYNENFSMIVRHASNKAALALVPSRDMHLEQMDVKKKIPWYYRGGNLHGETKGFQ